ncbi:MAG: hypothetical protein KKB51_04910 [Candidatus Riflebacteria bacterium]|nr:hypothetical protein [Candidatus Riflebacteria bacterium]
MIEYAFELDDGKKIGFKVLLNRTQEFAKEPGLYPSWTLLSFKKCTNCPLSENDHLYCPAAIDIKNVISEFAEISSIKEMNVAVQIRDRTIRKRCDAQTGLNSLVGLLMATSACPILFRLNSQAKFHLPFASFNETLYRTVGDYLIKQYLTKKEGGIPDFELIGLEALYKDLALLNSCFIERIKAVAKLDSSLNVIANLSSLSTIVHMSIGDQLKAFKDLI